MFVLFGQVFPTETGVFSGAGQFEIAFFPPVDHPAASHYPRYFGCVGEALRRSTRCMFSFSQRLWTQLGTIRLQRIPVTLAILV